MQQHTPSAVAPITDVDTVLHNNMAPPTSTQRARRRRGLGLAALDSQENNNNNNNSSSSSANGTGGVSTTSTASHAIHSLNYLLTGPQSSPLPLPLPSPSKQHGVLPSPSRDNVISTRARVAAAAAAATTPVASSSSSTAVGSQSNHAVSSTASSSSSHLSAPANANSGLFSSPGPSILPLTTSLASVPFSPMSFLTASPLTGSSSSQQNQERQTRRTRAQSRLNNGYKEDSVTVALSFMDTTPNTPNGPSLPTSHPFSPAVPSSHHHSTRSNNNATMSSSSSSSNNNNNSSSINNTLHVPFASPPHHQLRRRGASRHSSPALGRSFNVNTNSLLEADPDAPPVVLSTGDAPVPSSQALSHLDSGDAVKQEQQEQQQQQQQQMSKRRKTSSSDHHLLAVVTDVNSTPIKGSNVHVEHNLLTTNHSHLVQ